MKKTALLFLFLLPLPGLAQQAATPLGFEWMQETEAQLVKTRGLTLEPVFSNFEADSVINRLINTPDLSVIVSVHTGMKPWIENGHPIRKSIVYFNAHGKQTERTKGFGNWMQSWHTQNSLLQVERPAQANQPAFRLYIDPLLNLQAGSTTFNNGSGNFWINTRGVTARGDIGKRVSFETSFLENQAQMPLFVDLYARNQLVIPGQGRWKTFDTTGFDYAMASGYISVAASRWLNIQAGHGKHFVGDGYRSLLLSDNSFNYPFARFTANFGQRKQFQITSLYAALTNLKSISPVPPGTERLFQKKPAAFQILSWKPVRALELSFFQGVMWQSADSSNRMNTGLLFFNPVPGIGPAIEKLDGTNNYLLGAMFRFDFLKSFSVYGQAMLDQNGAGRKRKLGIQGGLKMFNLFTVKHLHAQAEFNKVRSFTYSAANAEQAWTHYGQPLAHPLGAGFTEFTANLQYKLGDFFFHGRGTWASIDANSTTTNYGQSPFLSDENGMLGSPVKNSFQYIDVRAGWMISYASNLNISAGITSRKIGLPGGNFNNEQLIYISLRTSLNNIYFDFF
jgi:Capsule assembly protein Wzi